ncbi:MAG TPA: PDZ domain-containing protein [Pyrinomonadaceae bacterium]|nr:PDZ domain-containing protein [Pyrinomonadaceae bacterium]
MRLKTNTKILTIVIFALIFSMYQETSAQRRKPRGKQPAQAAEVKPVAPEISYTVSMSKPWTHLLEVEMRLKSTTMPQAAEIQMPVWTPGSYLIREYARHVQDFTAKDASGGDLAWEKTNKNTWRIQTKAANEIVVKYNVYANELTVRTNELNADHAFFNNAALLMNVKGFLNAPSTVRVNPYGNWKVATGLPRVEGQANTFRAPNFDVLYDSPFEVGDHKEASFTVQGKPHRYVVEGEGNYDLNRITADTSKIIEESYKIFGDLPYDDYLFILNLRGGGGLEHLNSTALQFNRFGLTGARYKDFLSLVAHEFFHLWNVKRIRPDALGPFDYNNENYTKLLWVAEGATSHYEPVLLQRAGIITDKEFLAGKAAAIQALQNRPGRFQTSLEEASFDAWIKYYRQDENSVNNQISYYDKGDIVNFMLDLQIRRDSNGAKSLDDVMRYLYNEFAKKNKNFTPEDYQKISEMMAGKPLNDFFAKYVRGREEIDYNSILSGFGLQMTTGGGAAEKAYLGADLTQAGDRLTVRATPAETPAYEQGLNSADEIVAIDGNRASQTFLTGYLDTKRPGDKIKITVFRFDQMREIEITLGGRAPQSYKIVAVENPTADQKRLYLGYFGTELK